MRRSEGWDGFEGEARCWCILGGIGHVEELLIPARDFSGLGLRMLDIAEREWSDHRVNAKSGVVTAPGQTGSFESGAGLFPAPMKSRARPCTRWASGTASALGFAAGGRCNRPMAARPGRTTA